MAGGGGDEGLTDSPENCKLLFLAFSFFFFFSLFNAFLKKHITLFSEDKRQCVYIFLPEIQLSVLNLFSLHGSSLNIRQTKI